MPKLLSQSKYEEFESNSALQIRDQEERRAENARNLAGLRICILRALFMSPVSNIHPSSTVHLLLTLLCFCYIFGFLPILSLLITSDLGFYFVIFPCS